MSGLLDHFFRFVPAATWEGARHGMEYKLGEKGVGYYKAGQGLKLPAGESDDEKEGGSEGGATPTEGHAKPPPSNVPVSNEAATSSFLESMYSSAIGGATSPSPTEPPLPPLKGHSCAHCGGLGATLLCGRCGLVHYVREGSKGRRTPPWTQKPHPQHHLRALPPASFTAIIFPATLPVQPERDGGRQRQRDQRVPARPLAPPSACVQRCCSGSRRSGSRRSGSGHQDRQLRTSHPEGVPRRVPAAEPTR